MGCDEGFYVERPAAVSTAVAVTLEVVARDASRVEVDWGDGATSSEPVVGGGVTAAHRYGTTGPRTVTLTSADSCTGQPRTQVIRMGIDVDPPCDRRRDPAVRLADCEEALATLRVGHPDSGTVPATRTDIYCAAQPHGGERVGPRSPERPPAFDPAFFDCAGTQVQQSSERLHVRPGQRVALSLGVPATSLSVRIGSPRGPAGPRIAARRVGASGLKWRVTLPVGRRGRGTRLFAAVRRAGSRNDYVARLRVR